MEQKTLTPQEKAVSLFEFIRELNKLKQKLVLNMREHPLCRPLSELPPDPEHIRILHRDRVEEDTADLNQVLLSVRKPRFEGCPQPEAALEGWLVEGWDSWEHEFQTHACLARTGARQEDEVLEWFSDSPQRLDALDRWQARRAEWAERQRLLAQTMELFTDLYKRYFELAQFFLDALLEDFSGTLAFFGKQGPPLNSFLLRFSQFCLELQDRIIRVLDLIQLSPAAVQVVQHIRHGRAILLFQPVEKPLRR